MCSNNRAVTLCHSRAVSALGNAVQWQGTDDVYHRRDGRTPMLSEKVHFSWQFQNSYEVYRQRNPTHHHVPDAQGKTTQRPRLKSMHEHASRHSVKAMGSSVGCQFKHSFQWNNIALVSTCTRTPTPSPLTCYEMIGSNLDWSKSSGFCFASLTTLAFIHLVKRLEISTACFPM
jgi:hypothetical protein